MDKQKMIETFILELILLFIFLLFSYGCYMSYNNNHQLLKIIFFSGSVSFGIVTIGYTIINIT